ncbi:MAG TPA: GNAT family N-acetyltransferase [Tepidisphaeraceae bacterium]|jgi:ribosomal protein S18 acetylase RimI-like enzyme
MSDDSAPEDTLRDHFDQSAEAAEDLIEREEFVPEDHVDDVRDFDCGDTSYQTALSEWIKCGNPDNSASADIEKFNTDVWLYYNRAGNLIGFGSLGLTKWTLGEGSKKKVDVVLIPMVAVAKAHWGQPPGNCYADQIMDDLRAEALKYKESHPAVVLAVHPENKRAISFYERHGFKMIEPPMRDGHLRMAVANVEVQSPDDEENFDAGI